MKGIAKAVITVVIGSSVYAVSQTDIVENFSANTGMSQEEAEEYVKSIGEDDLASFTEIGNGFIGDGNDIIEIAEEIDCINYSYPWESTNLTCEEGKAQLYQVGIDEVNLGKAYKKLNQDGADDTDVSAAIPQIDRVNEDFGLPIIVQILDTGTIEESKNTNTYNKSLLQATLQSAQ